MYSCPYFLFLKTISELLEGGKNQLGNLCLHRKAISINLEEFKAGIKY